MKLISFVKSVYEASGSGNTPFILEAFDQNIEWHEAENSPYDIGTIFVGAQSIIEGVFGKIAEDFEEFEVKNEQFIESGNVVIMLGRYVGKTKSGKGLNAQAAHVWTIENGKITKFVGYTDTDQWRRVIGTGDVNVDGASLAKKQLKS
ncbi:nuclear transport factor 2 family protein [Neobacillus sp. OS1-32]|uniref:nuclear transport factor 2 family protein n=1 Tax=Neobacillus sp. OS1-32 TaxID=3070682 RepID=UPI0027DF0C08|nr:nuclear transport factor 2 family protein [Neobacillus sp. OS1-32]WML31760.1 nuclear transport factor 2 family protein [Neobacillus sp. OS1-32]